MEATGPAGRVTSTRLRGQHGDVDPQGDIVDELKRRAGAYSTRMMERERRLARCITGTDRKTERTQLANVLRALERVKPA